jgi:hypothetical protein
MAPHFDYLAYYDNDRSGVRRYRERCDRDFLDLVEGSRGQEKVLRHEYFHILDGAHFLLNPIGGIFNMSRLKARLAACAWLDARIASTGSTDRHANTALLELHNGPDRPLAFGLLYDVLSSYVFVLPHQVVSSDFLGDLIQHRRRGVLVQVRRRSVPQSDEHTVKAAGDLNGLCGLIVNPPAILSGLSAASARPAGNYLGTGRA